MGSPERHLVLKAARFSGAVALITFLSSLPALAHPGGDWYDITGGAGQRFPWDSPSDTIYSFSSGTSWPSGWKDAIIAADNKWNSVLGSVLFSNNTAEEPFPAADCGVDFNGQEIIRSANAANNALARTVICRNSNGQYGRWWITIDPDFTWFAGTGDAPSGQHHLRGIMVHEFGHATGFGTGTDPGEPDDHGHFHESDNNACPSLAADRATMCPAWGTLYHSVEHLMSTLEPHDTHTFLNVY